MGILAAGYEKTGLILPAGPVKCAQRYGWNNAVTTGRRTLVIVRRIGIGVCKDRYGVAGPTAFLTGRPFPFDVGDT